MDPEDDELLIVSSVILTSTRYYLDSTWLATERSAV
jgi:hypothetical protein